MNLEKILKYLDKKFNEKIAADWDNVGIQQLMAKPFQDFDKQIDKILVCLDLNQQGVDFAVKNNINLIITRHPFLFGNVEEQRKAKKTMIKDLVNKQIVVYSIHTNYDASPNQNLITLLSEEVQIAKAKRIGLDNEGYEIKLKNNLKPENLISSLTKVFPTNSLQISTNFNYENNLKQFYIVSGAGGQTMIDEKLSDCYFVTGEIKWHELVYASDNNISVIILGHYMENYFVEHISKLLSENFSEVNITSYDIKNQIKNFI